jgi:hypothetical protein
MHRLFIALSCAGCITIAASGEAAAQPFTPPADSRAAVAGINFSSGAPAGQRFKARFAECDRANTCDGRPLRFGCSNDRNRNTALLDLNNKALFFNAKMGLDADGSPLSQGAGAGTTDQPETSYLYPQPGRPSVNADRVPFIVVPGGGFERELGVKIGDIAAVVFKGKVTFALVADGGPTCKIGEGSIQLHELVGHKVCTQRAPNGDCTKLRNVGIERDVMYFIFKDSNRLIQEGLTPQNVNERLQEHGKRLFEALKSPG